MGSLKHRSWRRAGTGQRGLHLQPVVQQAPRKSPWPPSSVNMFGSCGPPSTHLTLPSPPVTRLWGSNGCTSPLGGTCHPALGAAGSFSVLWQDLTQRGWYAGARSQKDRLVSVCSGHSAAERGRLGKSSRVQAYVLTPGSQSPWEPVLFSRDGHTSSWLLQPRRGPCLGHGAESQRRRAQALSELSGWVASRS